MNTHKIKNLFLRQSYKDDWEEYQKSLRRKYVIKWDFVILTASNEEQANAYRMQIENRLHKGFLPKETHYAVLPDPEGKRVGSGGATFHVMKYIREQNKIKNCFENKRILVIHSGGDSKRVPQYSACGKLFSPVPRMLPDGRRSTLFDEFMIGMAGIPARLKDGMLVLSGDVLLLFNALQIDFAFEGAAAISIKEHVGTGKNHGVFLSDENGFVGNFLHKQSVEQLTKLGAVNEQGNVDLDTGAIVMDSRLLNSLFSLISTDGQNDTDKFDAFVNEKARLSFYGDFLYPLAAKSSLEQYRRESPEGEFCEELKRCREAIWDVLKDYKMKLLCLSPAEFIHFGTTKELLHLVTDEIENYEFLDWNAQVLAAGGYKGSAAVSNSLIERGVQLSKFCYVEDCYIGEGTKVEDGAVLSHVRLKQCKIPQHTTLHGIRLKNGKYVVRIYGTEDNPKGTLYQETPFLGTTLPVFLKNSGLTEQEIWKEEGQYLWSALIYPVCDTLEQAVEQALWLKEIAEGNTSHAKEYQTCERMSLYTSFNEADVEEISSWQKELDFLVRTELFVEAIEDRKSIEEATKVFVEGNMRSKEKTALLKRAGQSGFSTKMRLYYYLSKMTKEEDSEELEALCFATIRDMIFQQSLEAPALKKRRIKQEEVTIQLPVRINFGGGWSDTPPYCNEHGGTVLNTAIKLNDCYPVIVQMKKIDRPCIVLASTDSGAYEEFFELSKLQDCHNPFDSFSLHKAALTACGIIPLEKALLTDLLSELGGGFYLSTQVVGIPRGSGLGTSSILAAACVKGIFSFLGEEITDQELYERVICMEQIMSTGGGWQDQVGGLTKGIKLITTKPGLRQKICVQHLNLTDDTKQELQERLALIYTGQRRLARNLLREVVGRYIGGRQTSGEVLDEIQRKALLMCFELEKGNINAFAHLMNEHWGLSKQLDSGCTNTCIDQIFMSCEDLLEGRMICGAGGGGFLQVILKKGNTKDELQKRMKSVFQESGVGVWDCQLI